MWAIVPLIGGVECDIMPGLVGQVYKEGGETFLNIFKPGAGAILGVPIGKTHTDSLIDAFKLAEVYHYQPHERVSMMFDSYNVTVYGDIELLNINPREAYDLFLKSILDRRNLR